MPRRSEEQKFEAAVREQLRVRKMHAFYPVSLKSLANSEQQFARDWKSEGFARILPGTFQHSAAPIIYMFGSAKAMFLQTVRQGCLGASSPSEAFNQVSSDYFEILDAALSETPTDLLVLAGTSSYCLDSFPNDLDDLCLHLDRIIAENWMHSLGIYEARLLRSHLRGKGTACFLAFRMAMIAVIEIGLFENELVSPLAIDFFPSIQGRAEEIAERRKLLAWREETAENPVVPDDVLQSIV